MADLQEGRFWGSSLFVTLAGEREVAARLLLGASGASVTKGPWVLTSGSQMFAAGALGNHGCSLGS